MLLIYVFGEPGAGKSTLMRDAIGDRLKTGFRQHKPFAHIIFPFNGGLSTYLGDDDGKGLFPGTDRLSMGVQPKAIQLLQARCSGTIIAEGDRLGTISFFQSACKAGYHILAIHATSKQAAQARAERAKKAGKAQNATWLKGRISKVQKLAEYCKSHGEDITYVEIQADQKRPKAGHELLKLLKIKP